MNPGDGSDLSGHCPAFLPPWEEVQAQSEAQESIHIYYGPSSSLLSKVLGPIVPLNSHLIVSKFQQGHRLCSYFLYWPNTVPRSGAFWAMSRTWRDRGPCRKTLNMVSSSFMSHLEDKSNPETTHMDPRQHTDAVRTRATEAEKRKIVVGEKNKENRSL